MDLMVPNLDALQLLKLTSDILDNACGNPSTEHLGYNTYTIEVHCMTFEVVARKVNFDWEVHSWTKQVS